MHRRECGLHAFVAGRKVPPHGAPLLGCGVGAVKDVYVELGSATEGEERAQVLAELEGAVFAEDNHSHCQRTAGKSAPRSREARLKLL